MSKIIERGGWKDLGEVSVMGKKTDSSFCWEGTIKPDGIHKQAAEALGELLLENRDGSAVDPTPVTHLTDSERLAKPKAELPEKRLQIQDLEGRARQDSNLRPSDS
jgi:hypothetical protein